MSKTFLEALTSVGKNLQGEVTELKETKVAWINVKEAGADNTGTVDCTSIINACITAVKNGGTLFFPAGTYSHSGIVLEDKNVSIVGEGAKETILKCTANAHSIYSKKLSSGWRGKFTISKLRLERTDGTQQKAGIYLDTNYGFLIDDVTIVGHYYGIYNAGSWSCIYHNVYCTDGEYGFYFAPTSTNVIGTPITWYGCQADRNKVGVYCAPNSVAAFSLLGGQIANNTVKGIFIDASDALSKNETIQIASINFETNYGESDICIGNSASSKKPLSIDVNNCRFIRLSESSNTGIAIDIQGGDYVSIANCTMMSFLKGIKIGGWSTNITVSNSYCDSSVQLENASGSAFTLSEINYCNYSGIVDQMPKVKTDITSHITAGTGVSILRAYKYGAYVEIIAKTTAAISTTYQNIITFDDTAYMPKDADVSAGTLLTTESGYFFSYSSGKKIQNGKTLETGTFFTFRYRTD